MAHIDTMSTAPRVFELPPSLSNPHGSTEIHAESSIVIVGANGSGKTRLGSWIDISSPQKSLVHRVAAQKSLTMPETSTTSSLDFAENNLLYGYAEASATPDHKNGHKWGSKPNTILQNDFDKLLTYLFTEEFDESTKYRQQAKIKSKRVQPPETRLDIIKRIWEFVLPHRELIIGGGQIKARSKSGEVTPYPGSEMSDGERVIFYLIGQCLAAKKHGILIIDEPEIHLHKSLQNRLWDAIEAERPDCLFVYLTHDLDFAATRVNATKIWLKSYEDGQWDWHLVPTNDGIPERLLLEILGSRTPILFVEGEKNSLDYFLFSNLFKKHTIAPCGSSSAVIHSTSSFSHLKRLHSLKCQGIIDRDFRSPAEADYLRSMNIFCLNFSEIENVFLAEDVLRAVALNLHKTKTETDTIIEGAKNLIFELMSKEKERLVSAIVSARIEDSFSQFNAKAIGETAIAKSFGDLFSGIKHTFLVYNNHERCRYNNKESRLPRRASVIQQQRFASTSF